MCVALFHFNVPVSQCFQVQEQWVVLSLQNSFSLSFFFPGIAVVTILYLVLSFPAEISPGGDVSLVEDSIQGSSHRVVYHQPLIFSAFQELFCDQMLVFENESHFLDVIQRAMWHCTLVY